MPLTYYGEASIAYPAIFGAITPPSSYYFGLQIADVYPGGVVPVNAGQYCIPSSFDTFSVSGTGTNRIFVSTSTGFTGDSEPDWSSVSPGGTVVDGTVTWQDVASTAQWLSSSVVPSFNEVVGNNYARVAYANTQTNFPAPGGSNPTTGTNANLISFAASTAAWGTLAAISIHDALTGGNVIAFSYLSKHLVVASSGVAPSIPALTGLTLSLT